MEASTRNTEEAMWNLQEELRKLEETESTLRQEVKQEEVTLQALREEVLEAKMHRIAMQEITNCNWEDLLRTMGYVESFYGYPDMAKMEVPDKEDR